jgi:hypothetical protein
MAIEMYTSKKMQRRLVVLGKKEVEVFYWGTGWMIGFARTVLVHIIYPKRRVPPTWPLLDTMGVGTGTAAAMIVVVHVVKIPCIHSEIIAWIRVRWRILFDRPYFHIWMLYCHACTSLPTGMWDVDYCCAEYPIGVTMHFVYLLPYRQWWIR